MRHCGLPAHAGLFARPNADYIPPMQAFAALLDRLYYTHSNNAKAAILADYLRRTPDPDRGFAVGVIAGTLSFELFKRALVATSWRSAWTRCCWRCPTTMWARCPRRSRISGRAIREGRS